MFKRFTLAITAFMLVFAAMAENIPVSKAEQVAKNVYYEFSGVKQAQQELSEPFVISNENASLYYIFNLENQKGFVIVSADDRVLPILGYSLTGRYSEQNQPPQFVDWMKMYADQIHFVIENDLDATAEITSKWAQYTQSSANFSFNKNTKDVNPLLDPIAWNQDNGWNTYCPADPAGPGGHVYAGCVATAAGMVMKYWEHPISGTGSSSYYCAPYGTLSVDYSAATYDWAAMSATSATNAAAYLLYHVGVSVQMQYAPDGSGAYTSMLATSLADYFSYVPTMSFELKEDHPSDWESILMNELDNGRPMVYKGSGTDGGHAFGCDGYSSGGTYFHFNWGWSGYFNGNFSLSNLNPGGSSFTDDQGAVIGIEPDNTIVPTDPPSNLAAEVIDDNVYLSWDIPGTPTGGTEVELVYDNDSPTGSYYWEGATMATQMSPSESCQVLTLKYYTTGSGTFNAEVYDWTGSQPGTMMNQVNNVNAVDGDWLEVDVSGDNLNVTGDFVVGFGSTNTTAALGYDAGLNNGRSWDYDGSWSSWTEAYHIRAVVLYPDGKTEELVGKINPNRQNVSAKPKTKLSNSGNPTVEPIENMAVKANKELSAYRVYRDDVNISGDLSSSTLEYDDLALSSQTYIYCVKAVYGEDESDCSNEVEVTVSVGVDEIDATAKIYPNPTNDFIHLVFATEKEFKATITDITGRIVSFVEGSGKDNIVNLSNLDKGVYFVEIQTESERFTERIIVK